jgi:hypothetical protein
MSAKSLKQLERGFQRLVSDIPTAGDPGYNEAIQGMVNEIISSDKLMCYLVTTNIFNNIAQVTAINSTAHYSAGFGGSKALHGKIVTLLGEMVGDQLPMLVQFDPDPNEDLSHALAMEEVCVPLDTLVDLYFANPRAEKLMPAVTEALGGVLMNLSNLCPIPLAWAPYFMNFKSLKWGECWWLP